MYIMLKVLWAVGGLGLGPASDLRVTRCAAQTALLVRGIPSVRVHNKGAGVVSAPCPGSRLAISCASRGWPGSIRTSARNAADQRAVAR